MMINHSSADSDLRWNWAALAAGVSKGVSQATANFHCLVVSNRKAILVAEMTLSILKSWFIHVHREAEFV